MAGQTLSTFDALLKNVYRGPMINLLNNKTYMLDKIEKTDVNNLGTYNGRNLIFAVHTGRNRGRGNTTDGGQLATAGSQSALDATVSIKYYDIGIELTDPVIKQSKADEGAFVRALEFEMNGATVDTRKDINRQVYGTGDGLLASCTSTQATINTFAVDSVQYLAVGDPVDVIVKSSGATSTGATGRTVTTVVTTGTAGGSTQANGNVTISGAAISVDNTFGVYLAGDRSNETDGLRNIVSTGRTLHNINSSTYSIWDANTLDLAYSNPSEDKIMQLVQAIQQRSGTDPDVVVASPGGQRRLANQYVSQKRYNDAKATQIEGGYSAINVATGNATVPVIADYACPNGTMFVLNTGSFAWSEVAPIDWLTPPDGQGGAFHLKDGSSAGTKLGIWQAWMVWYATLVNIAPNRNGKLTSVADDKPVLIDQ